MSIGRFSTGVENTWCGECYLQKAKCVGRSRALSFLAPVFFFFNMTMSRRRRVADARHNSILVIF